MSCNSFTSFTSCSSSCEEFEYQYEDFSMISNNKLKTQLCRAYVQGEFCKFGDYCKFAHGWHELRCLPEQEKPLRKKCHGYWGQNQCKYGMKCKFQHHKPDWTSKVILRMHNDNTNQSRLLSVLNM